MTNSADSGGPATQTLAQPDIAKAGKLLLVDQGEYSDYSVVGFFVVLADFCPADELTAFLKARPDLAEDYSFDDDAFLAALIAKGFLLEIEYGNLYLGGYSCSESIKFTRRSGETRFTP